MSSLALHLKAKRFDINYICSIGICRVFVWKQPDVYLRLLTRGIKLSLVIAFRCEYRNIEKKEKWLLPVSVVLNCFEIININLLS